MRTGLILDASVLVAHPDNKDAHHERAVDLLPEAAEESFRASPITPAEVLTGPARIDPDCRVVLDDYAGAAVVLNFWATWCAPCREEIPAIGARARRYAGTVTFGVDHQDGRVGAAAFLDELGIGYRSGCDPDGNVARAYGLYGMPSTVLIRPDFTIATSHNGDLSVEVLRDLIAEHLDLDQRPNSETTP